MLKPYLLREKSSATRIPFESDNTFLEEETAMAIPIGSGLEESIWRPVTRKGTYSIKSQDQLNLFFLRPDSWLNTTKVDTIKELWKIINLTAEEFIVIRGKSGFETTLKFEGKKK